MIRFEWAVAADLAANVLSVCLVVFLTLLPLGGQPSGEASGRTDTRFFLTAHHPLSGPEMRRILWERRADPALTVIDLFADRVEVRQGVDAAQIVSPAEIARLAPARAALFVLDPAFYAPVRSVLGRRVPELSVPDALRDPGAPRLRFHPDFTTLDAAPQDEAEFDAALAHLLEAASAWRDGAGSAGMPGTGGSPASLSQRLAAWWRIAAVVGMPAAAALALALMEAAARRHRFRA